MKQADLDPQIVQALDRRDPSPAQARYKVAWHDKRDSNLYATEAQPKFLYLRSLDYVDPWINGGDVPLFSARKYVSVEREGTHTPDENNVQRVENLTGEQTEHIRTRIVGYGGVHARRVLLPGGEIAENVHLTSRPWEGIVLSTANSISKEVCKKLGAVCCVRIQRPSRLLVDVSSQLGLQGLHGCCSYTASGDRDIFLKSVKDSWQDEFRFMWSLENQALVTVKLKPGVAFFLWEI